MRDYEIVYIFDSALDRTVIDQRLERFNQLATGDGSGEILAVEHWGKRQLAYPIQKHDNGYYVVVQFRTEAKHLPEFERAIKLDEQVLRHLVVVSEGELPTPASSIAEPARFRRRDVEDEDEDEDNEDDEG
ncbi:MAG: 30S ribosomal protein S6 [Gemmatimonadota bacterium]|nr:MAG: 30S ribosomal protein S6 [Gemmatimonadota bacterium]